VATETAFTRSGRGRIPNFDLVFRTNLMEGRTFNYHKQYLQSIKIISPIIQAGISHGFLFAKENKRSADLGQSHCPFVECSVYSISFFIALKKETGLYVKDLYTEMAAACKKE